VTLEDLFHLKPYGLKKDVKVGILMDQLTRLTIHHEKSCGPYSNILSALGFRLENARHITDFPFLPVRLFKEFELKSIDDADVIKTLTSSGTTSQKLSRIFIDKQTSQYQTKALVNIMKDFIGTKRVPMIIADSPNIIKDRRTFSARGAGILGMSNFGRDHFYLLSENMDIDFAGLDNFLDKHRDEEILMFGFTFMIWQHLYKNLLNSNRAFDLSKVILIHSGGWKKLAEEAVDNFTFKKSLEEICGIHNSYNFYGMVEQIGSIFMECKAGNFHAPNFADIIIRDPFSWSDLPFLAEGVIEVASILPHSYPGHVLLTEDMGMILGEDNCACGRYGKYFSVTGRIPKAEIRGCSDTYAYEAA
jgi:hypothetical protein